MNSKAQTSLEFIVIMGLVLLSSFYFSSAIYGTSQINKSIWLVKQKSMDLLSLNNSRSYISSVNHSIIDSNINFNISIVDKDGYVFDVADYDITKQYIIDSSTFDVVNIYFNYM